MQMNPRDVHNADVVIQMIERAKPYFGMIHCRLDLNMHVEIVRAAVRNGDTDALSGTYDRLTKMANIFLLSALGNFPQNLAEVTALRGLSVGARKARELLDHRDMAVAA